MSKVVTFDNSPNNRIMKDLIKFGAITAIINHLTSTLNPKTDGIFEVNCRDGEFAKILKREGFTLYHGSDGSEDLINAAKAALPAFKNRFHVGEPKGKFKRDIVISLHGTIFGKLDSGQAFISVGKGFDNWDAYCLAVAPYVKRGAKTIQHGDYFVTFGVHS
jgi:hypothetical protein